MEYARRGVAACLDPVYQDTLNLLNNTAPSNRHIPEICMGKSPIRLVGILPTPWHLAAITLNIAAACSAADPSPLQILFLNPLHGLLQQTRPVRNVQFFPDPGLVGVYRLG